MYRGIEMGLAWIRTINNIQVTPVLLWAKAQPRWHWRDQEGPIRTWYYSAQANPGHHDYQNLASLLFSLKLELDCREFSLFFSFAKFQRWFVESSLLISIWSLAKSNKLKVQRWEAQNLRLGLEEWPRPAHRELFITHSGCCRPFLVSYCGRQMDKDTDQCSPLSMKRCAGHRRSENFCIEHYQILQLDWLTIDSAPRHNF